MQQALGKKKPTRTQQGVNPFARALAETESSLHDNGPAESKTSLLSEALAQTGGRFPQEDDSSTDLLQQQQAEQQKALETQEKKALKKKLHDKINPVDQADIFNAREEKVQEELKELRYELKLLAEEVLQFDKEVGLTLSHETPEPGQHGTYYFNFFHQLRSFIMLLRQKVKSARTWAKQTQARKARKTRGPAGPGAKQTKWVHDTLHHERSNAFSGA